MTSPSPLGLVVLAMLSEKPLHTYRMQRLIEARGKDRVVNVRARGTLYQVIDRLQRQGLVMVAERVGGDRHPDRVVYALTAAGRDAAGEWLRTMLTRVGSEFPDFPAALSVLTLLGPDEVADLLQRRVAAVEEQLAGAAVFTSSDELPRVFALEEEYRCALLCAERDWLTSVFDDLRAGRLSWTREWLDRVTEQLTPDGSSESSPARDRRIS